MKKKSRVPVKVLEIQVVKEEQNIDQIKVTPHFQNNHFDIGSPFLCATLLSQQNVFKIRIEKIIVLEFLCYQSR